jgi:hypothetical protein
MGAKHSRQNVMLNEHYRRESMHHQTSTITSTKSKSAHSITIEGRQYHHDETGTYALPRDELEQDRLNSVSISKHVNCISHILIFYLLKATLFIESLV